MPHSMVLYFRHDLLCIFTIYSTVSVQLVIYRKQRPYYASQKCIAGFLFCSNPNTLLILTLIVNKDILTT